MINYKCHLVLKEKADQLLRRNKTFFFDGPHMGHAAIDIFHNILTVRRLASVVRLVKAAALEIRAVTWYRHLSRRSRECAVH